MSAKNTVILLCLSVLLCGSAFGQATSSSVMGTVTDPSGAAIANVKVELKDDGTGATRSADTTAEGIFRFNSVVPGQYSIKIETQGFKTYSQAGVRLASSETRDLGRISLTIGTLAEQVSVTADATPVQTASSEKGSLVDATQLSRISLRGRDMFGFLQLIPGVTGAGGSETTGTGLPGAINGGGNKNFTVDGVTDMDTGSNGSVHFEPNVDSIAEIRVLTSNFQAEYGRNANGTISVITKGGGREFHGSGWENYRHESMNANSWSNIKSGLARNLYRYNVFGYSIGGPVYIPGKFNTGKQKLFFFVSQEYTRQRPSTSTSNFTMPTALERTGDFSKSVDSNGRLITVKDPLNNNAPFAGNKVDPSRITPLGLSILNFLPEPNRCDLSNNAAGCYNETDLTQINARNYRLSNSANHPRRNTILRGDVNLRSNLFAFVRYGADRDNVDTFNPNFGVKNGQGTRGAVVFDHPNPGHGYAVGITYTISPTMVNEFSFGKSYNTWDFYAKDDSQLLRDKQIPNLPHWYDSSKLPADPLFYKDYLPTMTFAGNNVPNPASFGNTNINDQEPRTNWNDIYSFTDSISRVSGKHNFKAGAYFERTNKVQGKGGYYNGYYQFGSDTQSTLDTGHGYLNALLGYATNYQEGVKTVYDTWFLNLEPYVQDNWRITKRLSLDLGMRFYITTPYVDNNGTFSTFDVTSWSLANAPRLYTYGTDAAGKAIAVDPLNPANVKPTPYRGLYVQDSTGKVIGDPANGWKNFGKGAGAVYSTSRFLPALRIGFAYDVFGNGKTAIRGGFGQFYNRFDVNQVYEMSGNPPYSYVPQVYYSSLSELATTPKALGPVSSANIMAGDQKVEGTMNGSFGIQQNVGFGTVVEASYVGAFRRHTLVRNDLNHLGLFPYLDSANWIPGSTTQKADIFLRPLQGVGAINAANFSGSTNYNSLQVSVNKRYSRGISYGLAYTFMKLISTTGQTYFFDMNTRNRNTSGVPHLLVFNYNYEVPKLGQRFHSKLLGAVTDSWTISGITTFSSGGWSGVSGSYSTTLQYGQTGGTPDGARINIVGDVKPVGEKGEYNQFNTSAFAMPAPCTPTNKTMACFGSAASAFMLGPGWSNWDMTLAKQIPTGLGERRKLLFRAEFYNIWNHLEFNAMNTSIQYALATGQRLTTGNNATFGQLNGAAAPRRIALSLRLEF